MDAPARSRNRKARGASAQPAQGLPVSPPLAARPIQPAQVDLSKRSVFYEYDKYDIKDEYRPVLQVHGKYLAENRGKKMLIQGNCDERGSREYNIALGQTQGRRGQAHARADGRDRIPGRAGQLGEEKPRCADHKRRMLVAEPPQRHALQRRILERCGCGSRLRFGPRSSRARPTRCPFRRRRRGAQADLPAEEQVESAPEGLRGAPRRRSTRGLERWIRGPEPIVDLAQLIESLKQDVAKLRGSIEVL